MEKQKKGEVSAEDIFKAQEAFKRAKILAEGQSGLLTQKQENIVPVIDAQGNTVGTQKQGAIVLPKPTETKPLAEKNKNLIDKLDNKLTEVDTAYNSLLSLEDKFNQGNSGTTSALARGGASKLQSMSFVPNAAFPASTQYNELKPEVQAQVALGITGSRQGLVSLGKASGKGIPEIGDQLEEGNDNFALLKQQLARKGIQHYDNKVKYGGELSDTEKAIYEKDKQDASYVSPFSQTGQETLSSYLSNPKISSKLKFQAAKYKSQGIPEDEILQALKKDAGIK